LAGALEVVLVAGVPVVVFACFLTCFVFTGAGVEGFVEVAGACAAKDRAAAKAVPNIKLVMRFIFVFSYCGAFSSALAMRDAGVC
jgi:hypothetical protein